MTELERIYTEGCDRIDAAIQSVFWKYDHKPYANGLNDDTKILQACIDDLGGIQLETAVYVIREPLVLRNDCKISGRGSEETAIKLRKPYC
jgi:hypothetical protein